jgi:hypothetical protein
MKCVAI